MIRFWSNTPKKQSRNIELKIHNLNNLNYDNDKKFNFCSKFCFAITLKLSKKN